MTETCAGSIYSTDFPAADTGQKFANLGTCVPGLRMRVVDDQDRELPPPARWASSSSPARWSPPATTATSRPPGPPSPPTAARRLGVTDLEIITVPTAPSVRALAARPTDDAAVQRPYDPVVTLQGSGDRTPLFCVHPGVGEVLVFVNLARYFVGDRPFHALRTRGFNAGETPFASMAEMVDTYLTAIRSRQPHGPYAVAGYSYGGAVAFEIAKRLEAEGERVDFVGSFNLPPHIKYRMNELDFVETATNLAFFLALIDKRQSLDLPDQLRGLPREEQLAHLVGIAPKERLAELDLDLAKFTAWAELADRLTDLGRRSRRRPRRPWRRPSTPSATSRGRAPGRRRRGDRPGRPPARIGLTTGDGLPDRPSPPSDTPTPRPGRLHVHRARRPVPAPRCRVRRHRALQGVQRAPGRRVGAAPGVVDQPVPPDRPARTGRRRRAGDRHRRRSGGRPGVATRTLARAPDPVSRTRAERGGERGAHVGAPARGWV
ncbi:thioesterase domain-containing protein [Micromonospora sp. WMMD882]|uniref:non-ribosomal peptide synthetase n=1 Tax=Micromonospora sp. WMMD882 TaxID=3015151 RepID=UPI00248B1907|nr:thioesterase domain-containing protein [Micromonospora sp. WMMD882]WBB79718.1 thioesterase domain-containing protein [Micromonospora sp. WMMD882]